MLHFKHNNSVTTDDSQFLVLVQVMKKHSAANYSASIPVVTMNSSNKPYKLVVISLNDIKHQVGLLQSDINSLEYKVIAPYYVFSDNVKTTAGKTTDI